jgi:hypothetical protein
MPSTYPTASDLAAFLTDAGVTSTSTQRTQAIAEAISQWEQMTVTPFLAEAADSTRYYDQGGGVTLELPPYVSITSVATGTTYDQSTGAEIAGVAAVRNVTYFASDDAPIRSLRFTRCQRSGTRSVKVVGKRGYTTTLSDEVWTAILKGAAASLFKTARNAATNGLQSVAIGSGDLAVTFAGIEKTVAADWEAAFQSAAKNPNFRQFSL